MNASRERGLQEAIADYMAGLERDKSLAREVDRKGELDWAWFWAMVAQAAWVAEAWERARAMGDLHFMAWAKRNL